MKRLDKEVACNGVGIPNMSATLVKRTDNICMYERWGSVWEVFRPNIIKKDTKLFGRVYDDDTEMYPVNEDFGKNAFCFSQKKYAEECYTKMAHKFK